MTKPSTTTQTRELEPWSKESPTVDGVYWWRADASDNDPDIHFVRGDFFYQVGFASSEAVANFGGEWLGPITPSTTERVIRLREALEAVIARFQREYRDLTDGQFGTVEDFHEIKAARAALQP
jgi:hypothetical protein